MLLDYADYLNNLRDSISVSFGNTGELLEAYKLTALLLINYAVMILVGLFACWAVCKFISIVTFYAIKLGIKFDGVYSDDDEIFHRFIGRAIKVLIVTEGVILLSYWFLTPTQLFLFPNMIVAAAKCNSTLIILFVGVYAFYAIYINWYILAEAAVVKASIKPLADSVYEPTDSVLSKYQIFYESAAKFELYIGGNNRNEIVNWALEEKVGREEFEKRLMDRLISNANVWRPFDMDTYITKGRRNALRRLCS